MLEPFFEIYFPAEQFFQRKQPCAFNPENLPHGQSLHAWSDEFVPFVEINVPPKHAVQFEQTNALVEVEYLPHKQALHCRFDVIELLEEMYSPAEQFL